MRTNDIFLDMLPSIDLHGFDRDSARIATRDFILESKLLSNYEILIIHGIGDGIVKNAVHTQLSKDKNVFEYKIASSNIGCTIVKLKK